VRVVVAAVAGVALVGAVPAVRAAEPAGPAAPGTPDTTTGPLVSGTASYVAGTYAWTDYAYDDTGPNTNASAGGDATYPASVDGGNAADLIQLQVARSRRGDVHLRAVLQTLVDADVPLLGVGLDTDGDPGTGAAGVPGGRWTPAQPLGLDVFATVSSAGGTLLRWQGGSWAEPVAVPATVDTGTNTMETALPRSALGGDAGTANDTWRAVAVVGLAQPDLSWLAGTGPIFDVAFVRAEDICTMPSPVPARCVPNPDNQLGQDQRQSDVLAGRLEGEHAVGTIDTGKLRSGVTEVATVSPGGFHTLLYHSDLDLGEGIRSSGSAVRSAVLPHELYAGPYQPYVIRMPARLTPPMPAIVYLHGRSGNHLQGFVNNFANFDPDAMVVGVLGRGPEVGYGGIDWLGFVEPEGAYGEQDVLDVLDDMTARSLVDPDRVVIGGISMGGVGAFHMAELHPDRFAGVLPIVGGDAGILPPNWGPGLIENLSNMPLRMANGAIDPLAHLGSQLTPAFLHGIRTVDFRAWEALRRHHEWQAGLVDCVFTELVSRPRVVDPARVIYTVNPAFEVTIPESGLAVSHTGAYWVSGLEVRPDVSDAQALVRSAVATSPAVGRIEVTSLARPDRDVVATPVAEAGQNFTAGADYCGPSTLRSNDAWEMNGLALTPGEPQATSNALTMRISGLTAASIDLARMGIGVDQPVLATIAGDGEGAITLHGPWPEGGLVDVLRDGDAAGTVEVADGAVTLEDDFLGEHDYVLTLRR
jgi:dienelactone hydrolase